MLAAHDTREYNVVIAFIGKELDSLQSSRMCSIYNWGFYYRFLEEKRRKNTETTNIWFENLV